MAWRDPELLGDLGKGQPRPLEQLDGDQAVEPPAPRRVGLERAQELQFGVMGAGAHADQSLGCIPTAFELPGFEPPRWRDPRDGRHSLQCFGGDVVGTMGSSLSLEEPRAHPLSQGFDMAA